MRDRVKFARNSALLSGVPALATILLGIASNNLLIAILPSVTLLFAVAGVVVWARQERKPKGKRD